MELDGIIKFTTRGYKGCKIRAHVLEIISTLQRAKTTDSRINPGRVRHEASARRGINSVTQNSRRARLQQIFNRGIVGNLTLETFELSKADPSASHVSWLFRIFDALINNSLVKEECVIERKW